jgi:hypothetical protein
LNDPIKKKNTFKIYYYIKLIFQYSRLTICASLIFVSVCLSVCLFFLCISLILSLIQPLILSCLLSLPPPSNTKKILKILVHCSKIITTPFLILFHFTLVHGNFSKFSNWSLCHEVNTTTWAKTGYRNCSNPAPFNGGMNCVGPTEDVSSTDCQPGKHMLKEASLVFPNINYFVFRSFFQY